MKTKEIITEPKSFKSLSKKSMIDNNENILIDENTNLIISTCLVDETGEKLAYIIGESLNLPLKDGNGCHIKLLQYPSNFIGDILEDLLNVFNNGVRWSASLNEDEMMTYNYNYLWFEKPDVENSYLLKHYKCIQSENDSNIFIFDLKS